MKNFARIIRVIGFFGILYGLFGLYATWFAREWEHKGQNWLLPALIIIVSVIFLKIGHTRLMKKNEK